MHSQNSGSIHQDLPDDQEFPLIGLVAAMIAVMLEVTEVYRVVSLSGIFIATGLVVLLVVTLIQTMDRIRELELARQREARESLDYLTGLPMRHKGEKLILEKMQKHDGCLGFVDMDNLKKINDVYGHKAGDCALRLVGAMLTECMENAVVCRLGGDEFLFYLPEASEAEMSMRIPVGGSDHQTGQRSRNLDFGNTENP